MDRKCGTCKHSRRAPIYSNAHIFCVWRESSDTCPQWISEQLMHEDDGQDCPAWEKRDDG